MASVWMGGHDIRGVVPHLTVIVNQRLTRLECYSEERLAAAGWYELILATIDVVPAEYRQHAVIMTVSVRPLWDRHPLNLGIRDHSALMHINLPRLGHREVKCNRTGNNLRLRINGERLELSLHTANKPIDAFRLDERSIWQ